MMKKIKSYCLGLSLDKIHLSEKLNIGLHVA
jgi:hypothetical protein